MDQNIKDRRIKELETAIRNHRDQKGDNRCWLDDLELYKVLNDGKSGDLSLPPKCEFLESCSRFWEQRHTNEGATIGKPTINQLEEKVILLEEKLINAGLLVSQLSNLIR